MHFNGVEKNLSERVLHDGHINCTALLQYREEFAAKTLCSVDKGVPKHVCAQVEILPPQKARRSHEYWAWDEELGRVWDPSLRLVNGRFIGNASSWAASWSEG